MRTLPPDNLSKNPVITHQVEGGRTVTRYKNGAHLLVAGQKIENDFQSEFNLNNFLDLSNEEIGKVLNEPSEIIRGFIYRLEILKSINKKDKNYLEFTEELEKLGIRL